ncbi:MAG: Type 1 glutamine amidotransferase-like domain-containing protein [Polyangiaceae bacterium]
MRGTSLVYSSHNRSPYLHDHFIAQRALRGRENKRILFLPMSGMLRNGDEMERQDYEWGTFKWFFRQYERYGLECFPFFYTSGLRHEDVQKLWYWLATSEVVILGGGHSQLGLSRYKELGAKFDGEWGKFGRILHERRERGLLTCGFSAGADQLCEWLFRKRWDDHSDTSGFGLVRNTMVSMHHEPSRNDELAEAAHKMRHNMVFGLPNDSGLYSDHGVLSSGLHWQVIEFVIDGSWDLPSDGWHIKTRHGAKIDHVSADGWHWSFSGGDYMVRIQSGDGSFNQAWMTSGGRLLHYWTREPSRYHSIEEVLASH